MKNIVTEHYDSIYDFLKVSKRRSNNNTMRGLTSSENTDSHNWYGTSSYKEAEKIFANGYTDVLQQVLDGVAQSEKINAELSNVPKIIPKNSIVGYVPNVPNAIIGIPESMINTSRVVNKVKTINVLYSSTVNGGVECDTIIKAGIAFLTAVKIIEKGGIFVNLDCSGLITTTSKEVAMATIKLKSFHERLDIQKLCFPLIHPSMERRFGFKWLETVPNLTDTKFRDGYGRSIDDPAQIITAFKMRPEVRVINVQWIQAHNFDVNAIIKYLKNGFK